MLRRAGGTIASPAALHGRGKCAAIRAEPVPCVPIENSLCLGERRQMLWVDQPLHGDRAQIRDEQIRVRRKCVARSSIEQNAEPGRAVAGPEEHGFADFGQVLCAGEAEQRVVGSRPSLHDDELAANDVRAAGGVARQLPKERGVRAPLAPSLEQGHSVTEPRLGAEVEGGHASSVGRESVQTSHEGQGRAMRVGTHVSSHASPGNHHTLRCRCVRPI